jgi:hypothetical protein
VGKSTERVIARLAARAWRGAIIGPHGSGKSTLLATLRPHLSQAPLPIEVVDGYEQLGRFARWQLRQRCRRAGRGLLVTCHFPCELPTLLELAPNEELVQQIVVELTATTLSPVTPAIVAASVARHGSNVREILFDLYDCHERLGRSARTASIAGTY